MESPENMQTRGDDGGAGKGDHPCMFGDRIANQDAGSALIMYDSGVHTSYTQNFVTRRAGRRGAIITGYGATLQFDWYTERMKVTDHHTGRVDDVHCPSQGSHGGGDGVLTRNFAQMMRGEAVSAAPLDAGLLSAAMCLAAREAAHSGQYQPVPRIGDRIEKHDIAAGTPVFTGHQLEPA